VRGPVANKCGVAYERSEASTRWSGPWAIVARVWPRHRHRVNSVVRGHVMSVIAAHKGSRARAAFCIVVGTAIAVMFINGLQRSPIGSLVSALGWLALGAAQAYRATFDTPVTAVSAGEERFEHYRVARFVTLLAFLTVVVGLAFRAHGL
jgi:hypothetical protein